MTAYMSLGHLTSQQLFDALIGDMTLSGDLHMSVCELCAGELNRLKTSLNLFRDTVRNWSGQTGAPEPDWRPRVIAAGDFGPLTGGMYAGNETRAGFLSLALHAAAVALLLLVGSLKPVQTIVKESVSLAFPDLRGYIAKSNRASGGGGGGARQMLDASKGNLPKPTPRAFIPPRVDPMEAKLQLPPSIVAADDLPDMQAMNFGDPLSKLGLASNGSGLNGIGNGIGGGIGTGRGGGVGPGAGAGFGGGVYRIGGGVSAPSVLFRVEPEYSEEARKAKWQGTVVLVLVVDAAGKAQNVRVVRSLGLGLDQKAIEAVSYWIFKPGFKDGKPVPVVATIEVNFRLL